MILLIVGGFVIFFILTSTTADVFTKRYILWYSAKSFFKINLFGCLFLSLFFAHYQ